MLVDWMVDCWEVILDAAVVAQLDCKMVGQGAAKLVDQMVQILAVGMGFEKVDMTVLMKASHWGDLSADGWVV